MDRDRGAVRQQGRDRGRERLRQLVAAEAGKIGVEPHVPHAPDVPARVVDPVLERVAARLAVIAPVPHGNEFVERAGPGGLAGTVATRADRIPALAGLPRELHLGRRPRLNRAFHRQHDVRLAVEEARHATDHLPRHAFADEHDAVADLVVDHAPDVEAEVNFLEILVKGNGRAEHPRVEELKSDQADVGFALPEVERRSGGNAIDEERRIDLPVEHHEVAPLGGQEWPAWFTVARTRATFYSLLHERPSRRHPAGARLMPRGEYGPSRGFSRAVDLVLTKQ